MDDNEHGNLKIMKIRIKINNTRKGRKKVNRKNNLNRAI